MNLEVPFNTETKIILDKKEFESLKINDTSFDAFKDKNKVVIADTTNILLGSGTYKIKYQKSSK